jgi:hypothetical protein
MPDPGYGPNHGQVLVYSWKNDSRLIPRTQSHSINDGLKARLKDPLWNLCRQWQLGKLRVRNGGHLVNAEVAYKIKEIDGIRYGTGNTDPFQPVIDKNQPLEPLIEEEKQQNGLIQKPDAWNTKKLEYEFAIKFGNTILKADNYFGDKLDWYHFCLAGKVDFSGITEYSSLMPVPVSFPGGPNRRWWQFEDYNCNLGEIERPNLNFLSMLLIEFSLVFGNDWFIIPLPQKVNSLRKIEKLTIVDSFGLYEEIMPLKDTSINRKFAGLFSLSGCDGTEDAGADIYYLPNTIIKTMQSDPIEEISVFRDELSNIVWFIEHKYLSGTLLKNRDDEEASLKQDVDIPDEFPLYKLKSFIPQNWIPYITIQQTPGTGDIILRRGRTDEMASANNTQYKGQLISESKYIYDEEIPEGVLKLLRKYKLLAYCPEEWKLEKINDINYKLIRNSTKKITLWIGRNKKRGENMKSIHLQYDYIIEKE